MAEQQEILHLWLVDAALDAEVVAWSAYPPAVAAALADLAGDDDHGRPYRTGVDALQAGWMLLQAPGPFRPDAIEHELGYEYVFHRMSP